MATSIFANQIDQNFIKKRDKALALLERTGISQRNFLPPTYPILWKMGFAVPPPHFMRFFSVLLLTGLPFGLCLVGIAMSMHETVNVSGFVVFVLFLATTFGSGFLIAAYYKAGRVRHRLPEWDAL